MTISEQDISPLNESIVKLLAYYQIFNHPLTADEICERVNYNAAKYEEVLDRLRGLEDTQVIKSDDGYYFLTEDKSTVNRRKEGEVRAKKLLKIANRMGKFIYTFPFIRAVFISGSLSKGVIHEDADIDYFIITKKHRLWVARLLLVLFKRTFLFGSHKYFCINYFVDEENLEIPDKNIFTATEVSTLIPLRGPEYCKKFMVQNQWYKEFYPNDNKNKPDIQNPKFWKTISKAIFEPLFIKPIAERMDKYFMKKTYQRWMRLYSKGYSEQEFELAFRSRRGTSKNHDKNFQKRVLNKVEENYQQAIARLQIEAVNG